jgi:serine protease Do
MKGLMRAMLMGPAALVLLVVAVRADGPATPDKTKGADVLSKPAPASVAELKVIQDRVKEVLKKVVPATVGIRIGGAAGSGVIIDAEGHVLTAGHVSGAPNRDCVLILPDGRQVKGKTLGRNPGIDSGLIQITAKGPWKFVEMGDSGNLKRGQWCLAVGHPGGFKKGRTPVVRLGRVLLSTKGLIQTDCTLVGGDSGGPLFDMDGKVIGIHSRIGPSITANIHVPVNTYRETWARLVKSETVGDSAPSPAFIGVRFARDSDSLEVIEVYPDTPARKAGVKAGDVIVSVGGQKVADRDALAAFMRKKKPGDEISLEVRRDGKPQTFQLTLGARPE